ncbi:MAG TPA: hypothetical protein VMN03_03270, partial [Burkholderiales bacterium]|nr:hypothetical protein [Burkholderiales bacterium]
PEFAARRGKRLKIEWTGFTVHIDDKLWPKKGKKKPRPPSTIDLRVEPEAIEFLVPQEVDKEKKQIAKTDEKYARKNGRKKKS